MAARLHSQETPISGTGRIDSYALRVLLITIGSSFTYDGLGRWWLNRDPIGEAGGVNLYAYVDGHPVSLDDLSGLCPAKCPLIPLAPPGANVNNNINIAKDIPANNTIWINTGWVNCAALMQLYKLAGKKGVWDYNTNQGTQYDEFGNFNFGAVAAAMGILYYVAQNAAGAIDVSGHSEGIPGLTWPYGDDAYGAAYIQQGYDHVQNGCNNP